MIVNPRRVTSLLCFWVLLVAFASAANETETTSAAAETTSAAAETTSAAAETTEAATEETSEAAGSTTDVPNFFNFTSGTDGCCYNGMRYKSSPCIVNYYGEPSFCFDGSWYDENQL